MPPRASQRGTRAPQRGLPLVLALLAGVFLACTNGLAPGSALAPVSTPPPAAPDLAAVPDWALASTARDGDSVVGIGAGASLDEATRLALQDLASRISISVESQLTDVYRESAGTSRESLERVIETRVLGTRFSGWERTRTHHGTDVYWVEVRIARSRLVRDMKVELAELTGFVDDRLADARGSALRRLLALQATATDRDRAAHLATLLDALDPEFDRKRYDAARARWREVDASARRSLIFEVRADRASQDIARWLESELVSERLRIRPGSCTNGEAVCIDIRSELTEADVASRHVAQIRSSFALLEPGGGVVREGDLIGRGDSKSDRERARRQALDDIRSRLSASSLLNGLLRP